MDKKYFIAEAANGLMVRVPAEKFSQWAARQKEISDEMDRKSMEVLARVEAKRQKMGKK